jgi:hypothetical protein
MEERREAGEVGRRRELLLGYIHSQGKLRGKREHSMFEGYTKFKFSLV